MITTEDIPLLIQWLIGCSASIFFMCFIAYIWPYPQIRIYKLKRSFFRAILQVTAINIDNGQSWEELKLDYKRLIKRSSKFKDQYRNISDLLEEFLYHYDTEGAQSLNLMTNIASTNATRAKVVMLIRIARSENPFLGIPNKEANILMMLSQALTDNNIELGKNSLIQLSQEIEKTTTMLETQEKRNITAYIISIVGVILTIVFGIISLKSIFWS
ncbi:MAG: hypothetical protein JST19_12270 [Bacteroidetes bacterium]|nr:hypothetical protein [Bacteroidota bacterium]